MLQVIARVVLADAAQPVPHPAVGSDDLEPQHQIAGVAVAQHLNAAGVGREIPADLTCPLGGERQREQEPGGLGLVLDILEDTAGLDRHGRVDGVDLAHRIHAAHVDQHAALGDRPAAQARIAALGGDGHAVFGADGDDLGDFFRIGGAQHQRAFAVVVIALLRQVGGHVGGCLVPALVAHGVFQRGAHGFGKRGHMGAVGHDRIP